MVVCVPARLWWRHSTKHLPTSTSHGRISLVRFFWCCLHWLYFFVSFWCSPDRPWFQHPRTLIFGPDWTKPEPIIDVYIHTFDIQKISIFNLWKFCLFTFHSAPKFHLSYHNTA
jgi:hypothetical protein